MRALGPLGREREHLRRQGADDARRGGGRRRVVDRRVHRVEVLPHEGERPVVAVPAHADDRRMADADAEQETARPRLGERLLAGRHRHRVARPDVRDARCDGDAPRRGEEDGGVRQRLAAQGLRDPDGAVAEALDLCGRLAHPRGRLQLERERPDADAAEVHGATPWRPRRRSSGGGSPARSAAQPRAPSSARRARTRGRAAGRPSRRSRARSRARCRRS